MQTIREERRVFLRLYAFAIGEGATIGRIERYRRRLEQLGTPSRLIDRAYEIGYRTFDALRAVNGPPTLDPAS